MGSGDSTCMERIVEGFLRGLHVCDGVGSGGVGVSVVVWGVYGGKRGECGRWGVCVVCLVGSRSVYVSV